MDREPEELQHLGAVGIVRESIKILRSCFRILGLITLTLILPLYFVILGNSLLTKSLFHKIAEDEFFFHAVAWTGNPMAKHTLHQIYVEWGKVLLIELPYLAFVLAFWLLSTSAAVYTVACLYTGRELSYATVISVVPRVWRRLMITFVWFFAIVFAYNVAIVIVIVIACFFWILINGLDTDRLNLGTFWFGVAVITLAFICVHVYISMVWQLASVVSVVEDKYGLGAMKKSKDLMKGKRGAALALNIVYLILVGVISQLFEYRVVYGGMHNVGAWRRTVDGALLVALECAVNLMWLLTQSVFYFVCKSYHHQSIDKSALADHLEGYLGEYMPLKDSISAIQLEHLDP